MFAEITTAPSCRLAVAIFGASLSFAPVDAASEGGPVQCPFGGPDINGECCDPEEQLTPAGICEAFDGETVRVGGTNPESGLDAFCSDPSNWNRRECGGSTGTDGGTGTSGGAGTGEGDNTTAPPPSDTPTPQENADETAECIVDNLDAEARAEATPHSVRLKARPRVGGIDVDGYAGCIPGSSYVTFVKESVAERGGAPLREVMVHEIAHHIAVDLTTCQSYDGSEHGSRFAEALGRTQSAAEECD